MASRDLKNDIKVVLAFEGDTIVTDTTTQGEIIDTAGYESVTFVMSTGAYTDGDASLILEESEDPSFTVSNVVASNFILNDLTDSTLDAANVSQTIGYVGHKRYVRMSVVTDNSADLYVSAVVILGHAEHNPVTQ